MKLFIDMDGVLVDFVNGACKLHGIPNPYDDGTCPVGQWDFVKTLMMSEEEFWKGMEEDFWAGLDPYPEAMKVIDYLKARCGIDNLCLLTSPSYNEGSPTGKLRWIKKHLPEFYRRVLIGPRKEFCAHKDSVLIDDGSHNIESFDSHSGYGILYPRMWNKLHFIVDLIDPVEYLEDELDVRDCQNIHS